MYGHECGNAAIQKLCYIICHVFEHSPMFRIGGDEFAVILIDRDYDDSSLLVEGLKIKLNRLKSDSRVSEWERESAAIGYSEYLPGSDAYAEDVFHCADALMYENKKAMKAVRE